MLQQINFVKAAASAKGVVPALACMCFYNDRVQAGNGRVTVDVALASNLNGYMVDAVKFAAAVEDCGGVPKITVAKEFVTVANAAFKYRARVALLPALDYPMVEPPQGTPLGRVRVDPLRLVRPFVATDASRPFAVTVLFSGDAVYATNNVTVVKASITSTFAAAVTVPVQCVDELLRLPFDEYDVWSHDTGLYFKPPNYDAWIHARSSQVQWPDVDKFFAGTPELPAVDAQGMLKDIARVRRQTPEGEPPVVCFTADGVRTVNGEAIVGDSEDITSKWRAETLELVLAHATHIDFSKYPAPCPWRGPRLNGVAVGWRS
jgi:hypothetical protein